MWSRARPTLSSPPSSRASRAPSKSTSALGWTKSLPAGDPRDDDDDDTSDVRDDGSGGGGFFDGSGGGRFDALGGSGGGRTEPDGGSGD